MFSDFMNCSAMPRFSIHMSLFRGFLLYLPTFRGLARFSSSVIRSIPSARSNCKSSTLTFATFKLPLKRSLNQLVNVFCWICFQLSSTFLAISVERKLELLAQTYEPHPKVQPRLNSHPKMAINNIKLPRYL